MLPEKIIEPGTFAVVADRVSVSIRMPWYGALPLSSVADVRWTIDGAEVPRDSITWTVNGTTRRLDELLPLFDQWWYVLDSAVFEGELPAAAGQGPEHDVGIVLALLIPELTSAFGVLKIEESDHKRIRRNVPE